MLAAPKATAGPAFAAAFAFSYGYGQRKMDASARPPRLAALAHRDFRVLWMGMLFASLTLAFQYYAQMWLIYGITRSAAVLGILGVVRGGAMLLFGLYGGALADRLDRRVLLIATESLALAVNASLGLLAIAGAVELWHVFALIFAGAAIGALDAPIRQALVPELVPREHIPNAVALASAAQIGSFAVTPVLAGFVIASLGPGGAYLLSTLGNTAVVIALLLLDYRGAPRAARREAVLVSIRQGFAHARRERVILAILAVNFATAALGMAIYQGVIVKWAGEVLGLEPAPYGLLAATWGVGTLGASYGLSFMGEIRRKGRIFVWSSLVFGLSFVLFGLVRWLPLAALAYVINGAAWSAASITSAAIVQSIVPDELRGRVMSLFMINGAVAQLNALALGAAADAIGIERLLPGATLLCSALVAALALGSRTLRRLDARVAARLGARSDA